MSARSKAKSQLPAPRDGIDEHPSAAARVLSEIIERSGHTSSGCGRAIRTRHPPRSSPSWRSSTWPR